ncbi:AsnC family transcriptional regulator [Nitrospira sp.]|nr:AsnC family transcriptional regulator [Nitrospira sp.]
MADRAYVLITVSAGQTRDVIKSLSQLKEVKTIDPCWGKPDIFAVVEVLDQDALTSLVRSKIHSIPGVAQTETHLIYKLST